MSRLFDLASYFSGVFECEQEEGSEQPQQDARVVGNFPEDAYRRVNRKANAGQASWENWGFTDIGRKTCQVTPIRNSSGTGF